MYRPPISTACVALGWLVLSACAPSMNAAFTTAQGAGDRAYSAGRYEEAASAYQIASERATRPRDRSEAHYLAAAAYLRARDWDKARAAYDALIATAPSSERAHRAAFDRASLELSAGNDEKGYQLLLQALLLYPNDGLARRALERYVAYLDANHVGALGWLRSVLPQLALTELDETVRYTLAEHLESASDLEGAREIFVTCARAHPYPKGSLFDDALWHASLIDEKLGRVDDAVADLRQMLVVREVSTLTGSYERPRFSPAQFRIAVLYRDRLHDHASARREFHLLYAEHTTSVLRDDALWEEAKLAQEDAAPAVACALTTTLTKEFPDSRYSACASALCPQTAPSKARCHEYLLRERREE